MRCSPVIFWFVCCFTLLAGLTGCRLVSPKVKPVAASRLVDIGGGRKIHVEIRGAGVPTVVLISGFRGAYDDWSTVQNASGKMESSERAVLAQVAGFTRVVAYDRPGTTRLDGSPTPSTTRLQPTSAADGVEDLHAVLTAAQVPGPYVLVAHSLGGTIARLYASRYPGEVAGLVLVDPATEFLKTFLNPEQWAQFVRSAKQPGNPVQLEAADYEATAAELLAAQSLPAIPSVVISADKRFDFGAGGPETWPAWLAAHDRLAKILGSEHITKSDSSHGIQLEQPLLVVESIRKVVQKVRDLEDR